MTIKNSNYGKKKMTCEERQAFKKDLGKFCGKVYFRALMIGVAGLLIQSTLYALVYYERRID